MGKPAHTCYRATLRPAHAALVAPGMSCSQSGSVSCCTTCSDDASKAVLSRLTKCSGMSVVGVGVYPAYCLLSPTIRWWLIHDAGRLRIPSSLDGRLLSQGCASLLRALLACSTLKGAFKCSSFMTTRAMPHDKLAGGGTLHGVIVSRVTQPNASVRVNPGCECRAGRFLRQAEALPSSARVRSTPHAGGCPATRGCCRIATSYINTKPVLAKWNCKHVFPG